MPIRYIPYPQSEEVDIIARWGEISGILDSQSDLAEALSGKSDIDHTHDLEYEPKNAELTAHLSSVTNPHNISKETVGLSNVDNLSQLSRVAADFTNFDLKSQVEAEDIILIEDSQNGFAKKYIKAQSLIHEPQEIRLNRLLHFTFDEEINLLPGETIRLSNKFAILPNDISPLIKSVFYSLQQGESVVFDLLLNNSILYNNLSISEGKGEISIGEMPLDLGDTISIILTQSGVPAKYLTVAVMIEYGVMS